MILHGPDAEAEFSSDLLIAPALRHRHRYALLGFSQALIAGRRRIIWLRRTDEPRDLGVGALHAVENAGDDGKQFIRLKRFCQIGVHAGAKARNAVGLLIPGGQEDYRNEIGARR